MIKKSIKYDLLLKKKLFLLSKLQKQLCCLIYFVETVILSFQDLYENDVDGMALIHLYSNLGQNLKETSQCIVHVRQILTNNCLCL